MYPRLAFNCSSPALTSQVTWLQVWTPRRSYSTDFWHRCKNNSMDKTIFSTKVVGTNMKKWTWSKQQTEKLTQNEIIGISIKSKTKFLKNIRDLDFSRVLRHYIKSYHLSTTYISIIYLSIHHLSPIDSVSVEDPD
jgi:hypothetical protein